MEASSNKVTRRQFVAGVGAMGGAASLGIAGPAAAGLDTTASAPMDARVTPAARYIWQNLGGYIVGDPIAISRREGELIVCSIGGNGRLYRRYFLYSWEPWARVFDGQIPPVSVVWTGDEFSYAARGNGNRLYVRNDFLARTYGDQWVNVYPAAQFLYGPTQLENLNGYVDVFITGTDHRLRGMQINWTFPPFMHDMGGYLTSSPVAVQGLWQTGTPFYSIFARGQDNAIWSIGRDSNGTGLWRSLGGQATSAPGGASPANGHLVVFARGTDGQLYGRTNENRKWGPWLNYGHPSGGRLASAPAVTSWGPGKIDVFVTTESRELWRLSL